MLFRSKLQVPYERLMPTRPFSGVTEGLTTPLGQVRLAVSFGTQANYRTELIDFDVAHIGLPYNAILDGAAFEVNEGRGSSGVVVRDCKGKFIAAASTCIPFVSDAAMAEAYALSDGLSSLAQHLGLTKFVIESDNMQVIDTMRDGGFSAASAAALYYDCKILASGFTHISYVHCVRDCNEVAHLLARNSFHFFTTNVWDGDPPSFILPAMTNDVTVLDNQ